MYKYQVLYAVPRAKITESNTVVRLSWFRAALFQFMYICISPSIITESENGIGANVGNPSVYAGRKLYR